MTTQRKNPDVIADADLDTATGGLGFGKATHRVVDLDRTDRLGNFEIQDLMSRFNQAQTLASSVQKKTDDTKSAVIGKI